MATNLLALPRVQCTFEVFTNEDWLDALAFYDPDGNPLLLDGIYFAMEARKEVEDVTALISITNSPYDDPTGGQIVTSGNEFRIDVPLSKMSRVPRGDYVFDAVGSAEGMQRVVITGTLSVVEGVTR
jgi:hypothetical protein